MCIRDSVYDAHDLWTNAQNVVHVQIFCSGQFRQVTSFEFYWQAVLIKGLAGQEAQMGVGEKSGEAMSFWRSPKPRLKLAIMLG